ncbi:MAG: hypothetical protein OXC44_07095, partial [Proteobacteria bacterium]|nr:hypothetical protein [Pseudomonadota bacterium]
PPPPPPENNGSLVIKKDHVFSSYGNTFKIDKVFDHVESFALMDYFGDHRGLCGFSYDNYNPSNDYRHRFTEQQGLKAARNSYYEDHSTASDGSKCQIVCEHSADSLANSFKRGYVKSLLGYSDFFALTNEDNKAIAQKIKEKFNDSRSCEIHSFQSWTENNNNEVTHNKEELAWMRYGSKWYINHFEKNKHAGAPLHFDFYLGEVMPFSDYTYLDAGREPTRWRILPNRAPAGERPHDLGICSRTVVGLQSIDRVNNYDSNDRKFENYMLHGYRYASKPEDLLPEEDLFGKCMRVCNITEDRSEPKCNVKRVGREYIKLQEFFGGLKASFCDPDERMKKIREGFINEIQAAKNKLSQWNPGVFKPEEDKKFEEQVVVGNVENHDFNGPIKSIELIDDSSNQGDFSASIKEGEGKENACVIEALNRYIQTSLKTNELRLMIHKAHFDENCTSQRDAYFKALKALEFSSSDGSSDPDKGDRIEVYYKPKTKKPEEPS